MIQVADNFNYRGKKPNFDRDSFDTLQDMKNYSENSLDDGHISYCKETGKHYKFNSNNILDSTTENISFIARGILLDQKFSKDIVKYIDYEDIPTLNMVANLGGVFIEYIKGKPVISGDMYVSKMGTTQERPANIINKGFQYFDTTINKPIYWDGSKWIDATGATV